MFGKTLARLVPGRPIPVRTVNAAIAETERLSQISTTPPLDCLDTASGPSYRLVLPPRMDARITAVGTGGKYAWRGIAADATAPGAWIDLDSSVAGTTTVDPFVERNGNATLPVGTRVEMERKMGIWIGSYDKCS